MIYGTLTQAREYAAQGKIEEWLQLFLRNDGANVVLADGLLLEPRRYVGPCKINLKQLKIKAGAPEYLTKENDIQYFFAIVDGMKAHYREWDVPPLIVEYDSGIFRVNDGRHRLEMYRQLGVENANAVLWATGEKNYGEMMDLLKTRLAEVI
uniref:hypothetical protein n=1 Tax=Acetatifactor sp. TaxID=1872090 RepID=UPI004055E706